MTGRPKQTRLHSPGSIWSTLSVAALSPASTGLLEQQRVFVPPHQVCDSVALSVTDKDSQGLQTCAGNCLRCGVATKAA